MLYFWIRGTSTYFAPTGATMTVPTGTEDAPDTIGTPAAPAWVRVHVMGANPTLTNEGDSYTTPSGGKYKDSRPRWKFTMKTARYGFEADWAEFKALMQHLSRQYVYLAVDDYPVDLHPVNTCMLVTATITQEDNYDDGTKRLTIEFEKSHIGEALDA